jgi:hypothetical protein
VKISPQRHEGRTKIAQRKQKTRNKSEQKTKKQDTKRTKQNLDGVFLSLLSSFLSSVFFVALCATFVPLW